MSYGLIGDWKYNQFDGVHYWGVPENGCGVYRTDKGLYTGTVIVRGDINFLNDYPTLDAAKKDAIKLYKQLRHALYA